jgi:hypothetical protein
MSQNDSWVWNLAHDESVWPESLPARTSTMSLELERRAMQDVVMLLFTVVFFALAFLYVKACQKLR